LLTSHRKLVRTSR